MADPKPAPKNRNRTYAYAGLGVGAVVIGYVYLKRRAASAANAQTATSGGGSIPTTLVASTGTTGPTTLAGWIQQALSTMTGTGYGSTAALNDINDWLSGQCVSAKGYTAIGNIVATLGLPPGFSTVPTLSVCAGKTTTTTTTTTPVTAAPNSPPNLSQSLIAAMTANGEKLVGSPQWDATIKEWLYATDKGGIYALNPNGSNGATFYGSYLGLPASGRQGGSRTFTGLTVNGNGTYTLTDTAGENYTFTSTTPQGG